MYVWIEYGPLKESDHKINKRVDKTDKAIDEIAKRHSARFIGSGYLLANNIRDREYKIPHKYLPGFFTEVTDQWKKFKLHRVVVDAK